MHRRNHSQSRSRCVLHPHLASNQGRAAGSSETGKAKLRGDSRVAPLTGSTGAALSSLAEGGTRRLRVTAIITLAALAVGSEAIAILLVAILVLIGLQLAGKDRPITPSDPSVTRRWYLWIAGAAGAFLFGLGVVVATEEDGGLSEVAWATWMLSWAAGAVLGVIGLGLGATRLITHRN